MTDPALAMQPIISEVRERPFKWGSQDCLTFSGACAEAILSKSVLPELDYSTERGALRLLKSHDATLDDLYDRFFQIVPPFMAKRGDIALVRHVGLWGKALAVVQGDTALTTGDDGLVSIEMADWIKCWSVK